MSIASEITRIKKAKSDLKTAIISKGVAVADSASLSKYAELVTTISTGGSDENLTKMVLRTVETLALPSGLTKIGDYAFAGCSSLTTLSVPDTVTEIGERAFYNCTALTPIAWDNVTSIGAYAFYQCKKFKPESGKSQLPSGLITIGNSAFEGSALAIIEIPASVTTIEAHALSSVTAYNLTFKGRPTSISSVAFGSSVWNIYVPWSEASTTNNNAPWGATNATIHYNYTGETKT